MYVLHAKFDGKTVLNEQYLYINEWQKKIKREMMFILTIKS